MGIVSLKFKIVNIITFLIDASVVKIISCLLQPIRVFLKSNTAKYITYSPRYVYNVLRTLFL